jgi:probable HAF family extracellular repeat protein
MLHRIWNRRSALLSQPGAGRVRATSPRPERLEARSLLASISDLGPFNTIFGAGVAGINSTAEVAETGGSLDSLEAAFLDNNGVSHAIAPLSGYAESVATGVNDVGQVVGYCQQTGSMNSTQEAFLYSQGAVTDLGTLGGSTSEASAINDADQVVGSSTTGTSFSSPTHAFLYSNGTMTDLGTLGGDSSDATAINVVGQIVGDSTTKSGATHAFLESGGTMTDLGVPAGYDDSYANAINTYGQIVGYATKGSFPDVVEEAFEYSQGQWIDLGNLGGTTSVATGIDDEGQIVGYSTTSTRIDPPQDAFLYTSQGGIQDLNSILGTGSGWTLQTAVAINPNGAILGIGTLSNQSHGYILYPPTGPGPGDPGPGGRTTTTLRVDAASAVYGQAVTVSATVRAASVASGTPTGTVTFLDGTQTLGSAPVDNGVATLTIDTLAIGKHPITAAYSGDSEFSRSTSTSVDETVVPDGTTVSVASLSGPAGVGQPVTFSARVSPVAPGGGTPTGSVTFLDGSTTLGTVALSGGVATFTISTLSLGGHAITAVYGGSTDYLAGTSAPLEQTIGSMRFGTVSILKAKPRSTKAGRPITLTARVTVAGGVTGDPTGSVTFLDGTTEIGTVVLRNGRASLRISSLPVGQDAIRVIYGGDGNDSPSTSEPLLATVVADRSKIARGRRARNRMRLS